MRYVTSLCFIVAILLISGCQNNDSTGDSGGDTLEVSLTLKSLPSEVTINKDSTPEGSVEFFWGVVFDVDQSGSFSKGDIALEVKHFKTGDAVEKNIALSELEADLWRHLDEFTTISVTQANLRTQGNTITISIDKSAYSSLESITADTLVYFETSTLDSAGELTVSDYYPSYASFTNITSDFTFTDPEDDLDYFIFSDEDLSQFGYIDLISMEIRL